MLHTLCNSLLHTLRFSFPPLFFSPHSGFLFVSPGKAKRNRGAGHGGGKLQRVCIIHLLTLRNILLQKIASESVQCKNFIYRRIISKLIANYKFEILKLKKNHTLLFYRRIFPFLSCIIPLVQEFP